MAGNSDRSAGFGAAAKAKWILLGASDELKDRVRSLNIEHVSPARLNGPGISRRPASVVAEEELTLALMRRWFFARKPDAGFVLTEFPATLLQAKVFDEWLEARSEMLTGVHVSVGAPETVVAHYRMLGLLGQPGESMASEAPWAEVGLA